MDGEREALVEPIDDAAVGGRASGRARTSSPRLARAAAAENDAVEPPEDLVLGLGVVVALGGEVVDGEEARVA